jgi:secondary thiamine-phosphate synthase enzyme
MSSALTSQVQVESLGEIETSGLYKVHAANIDVATHNRVELLNLTGLLAGITQRSGVKEGRLWLQTLHTTTGVILSEWQDALRQDIIDGLEMLVPRKKYWRHNDNKFSDCDRENADSHIRGLLLGQTLNVQVRSSTLVLGTWQQILFAELDGPRRRSLCVQVSGV